MFTVINNVLNAFGWTPVGVIMVAVLAILIFK